ncbi:MAG: molybdopterin dinucleotide binding domain-containing protein [Planctomycetota bacterium]
MTAPRKYLLNPSRTAQQGVHINVGKDGEEYIRITTTLTIHPDDMKEIGVEDGDKVRVRTEHGEAVFSCETGKVPEGMIFVPYGPPTCQLMGGDTDGTGMPMSKGWEVEVEKI